MRLKSFLFSVIAICSFSITTVISQNATSSLGTVSGKIQDYQTAEPISYGTVALINTKDSSLAGGEITDDAGSFKLENVHYGNYIIKFSFIGYQTYRTESFTISASQTSKTFGTIKLKSSVTGLKTVTVVGVEKRVEQSGDTVAYNANGYKTHPDANAEDLVTKMPGITSNNGNVTAHGENVKQVLVDGKPFFGDDPTMALKNLPAEVIDKIQVFDKLSDQSQFTGFDDGNSTKTINIVTKAGRNNGTFGKIYAGYGPYDNSIDADNARYLVGGNLNYFNGERRISILELSNNVNQQNFASQDLLGLSGGSGGGGGRGGFGGGGGGQFGGAGGPMGGGPGGGGANNFLVGQQSGIAATQALGLNYSDKWGQNVKVTASYFFNYTDNLNETNLTRHYTTAKDSGLYYQEADSTRNRNYNHRATVRLEWKLDSMNSFIITPKFNYQNNHTYSSVFGNNLFIGENTPESATTNTNNTYLSGYTFDNNILFQHKFAKRGRTISWNIGTSLNDKTGNNTLNATNQYYVNDTLRNYPPTNQYATQHTSGYTVSTSLVYTEPLDSFSRLMFTYSPSYTYNLTDKETNNFNTSDNNYNFLDTALSNKFKSVNIINKGGVGYNINKKKFMFMATINAQYATLTGNQDYPVAFSADKTFFNILPQAMFNYKFNKGTNLRIMYRTSTNTPSITQLQNVINNSNPLLLTTGNPELKQDFEHTIIVRYGKTNTQKATGLFFFLYGNYAMDYLGNSIILPSKDTVVNNYRINKGSQLSKPVNLQNYYNTKGLITYALPLLKIKSNLNFNTGFSYTHTPSLVNGVNNQTNNELYNAGTGLSSNISENIDFNIAYNANYSIANNTLQPSSNSSYFYHTATVKFNWILWKRLVFNTQFTHTLYSGLSSTLDKPYELLNISLAYKLLKNKSLEIKASVFDALKQNSSISRSVTDTYIEDDNTKVLTQYYMLTLTYNLRKFKAAPPKPDKE